MLIALRKVDYSARRAFDRQAGLKCSQDEPLFLSLRVDPPLDRSGYPFNGTAIINAADMREGVSKFLYPFHASCLAPASLSGNQTSLCSQVITPGPVGLGMQPMPKTVGGLSRTARSMRLDMLLPILALISHAPAAPT